MIDNIKSEIPCLRDDVGVEFQRWYNEAKQLTSYISTEEEMPLSFVHLMCSSSHLEAAIIRVN